MLRKIVAALLAVCGILFFAPAAHAAVAKPAPISQQTTIVTPTPHAGAHAVKPAGTTYGTNGRASVIVDRSGLYVYRVTTAPGATLRFSYGGWPTGTVYTSSGVDKYVNIPATWVDVSFNNGTSWSGPLK